MSQTTQRSAVIEQWPDESREAAQLVIEAHGEPHEVTESFLVWHNVGPWKRVIASKDFYQHEFPAPHIDSVESVINYRVPPEKATDLARFDGSVVVERTVGEVSARCHDEQANTLALNLMHDLATGQRTVEEARHYYSQEFLGYRRKDPTPYMQRLQFHPPAGGTADPDDRSLSDEQLEKAIEEGERRGD
jgi:hypothetical protein